MVAPLFWEQEEQFDSDILHHRGQRANDRRPSVKVTFNLEAYKRVMM